MTRPIAIILALLGVVMVLLGAHHVRAADSAVVVTACGTPPVTYRAGQQQPMLQNTAGNVCTAGGGGGGGGAVTGALGSFVDGWSVTGGLTSDTVCPTDTGTCTDVAIFKRNNARLTSIITALGSPFQAGGALGAGTAILGKISQVDSAGVDATDTVNHAVNVSCLSGCPAAITNYEQETGGNADLQTSYLLALKNAIGLPIPAQATDGVNIGGVEGLAARGTTSTGNPVLGGCRAATASPVAVTNGQAIETMCSETGKVVVLPYSISANFVSGVISTAMTATTSTQLLAAPAAGLRNYVTHIECGNAAASQGTFIIVQDGSAGTTIYEFPAAPAFGGASLTLPTPLRQPTLATALFVQNVTTGASVTCSASGYVAP